MEKKTEKIDWTPFARAGGQALLEKYGKEYFKKIANIRWKRVKELKGRKIIKK